MTLTQNSEYYLSVKDAVLLAFPSESRRRNAVNHLILGDELTYLNEKEGEWAKFESRRSIGWLKTSWITDQRLLEVNFVDIGQGDGCHLITPDNKIILIDAGEGIGFDGKAADHMQRFLNWRYDLRNRKVVGADDIEEDTIETLPPLTIDHAVISHPDLDHYYGFLNLFKNPKLNFENVYHNGIIERSLKGGTSSEWLYDFGRKFPPLTYQRKYYLWDTVLTHQEMLDLLAEQKTSSKYYLKTLRAAHEFNPNVQFKFLSRLDEFMAPFTANSPLSLEVLGPLTETVEFENKTRQCLVKLGNESKTKNGHSIIFQLRYGKLKMMLGGDLNTESQDYLAQHYSGISTKLSDIEKAIRKIQHDLLDKDGISLKKRRQLLQDLDEHAKLQQLIISKTRRKFGTDIAKACHHGSSQVLDSFLKAVHPIATVISSGDNESHSHPRPDALGAYGKAGRGSRPLLFSTELARSTNEFSYPIKFYGVLKKMEARMNEVETPALKKMYKTRMEKLRDSNVARYGMITVRTDGEKVIIAQKLERNIGNKRKWDIYELKWNEKLHAFES